jgi:hypothetical protein
MVRLASNGSFYGGAFGIAASVTTGPVLSKDGNFVYIGYDNGLLLARTATLNSEWSFSTSSVSGLSRPIRGTPSTDGSGHIYFGADDGNVYALYGDGRLKWNFTTGGEVRTQPAIGNGGIVYAGSYDNNLWAIDEFSEPRNYRQNIPNAPDPELEQNLVAYDAADATDPYPAGFIPTNSDDWIRSGPWAVRMEVTRDTISGDRGDYQLRTWMYQCGNGDCSDILGTFYENTRIEFDPGNLPPLLVQSFSLPDNGSGPIAGTPDNRDFERFLFGFTSASETGDSQIITIRNFQLSFIRPGDPVTTEDFLP